jgi:hypothetical protein
MEPLARDPARLLIVVLVGVTGVIVALGGAVGAPAALAIGGVLLRWAGIITGVALLVGLTAIASHHLRRIAARDGEWLQSVIILTSMAAVIITGTLVGFSPEGIVVLPASLSERPFRDLFSLIYQPLAASFLGLLAFFAISAAFRASRRGSPEAIVIIAVGALLLIGSATPADALGAPVAEVLAAIDAGIVVPAARGVLIGAAIGAIVAGVRVFIGLDRPYLDR